MTPRSWTAVVLLIAVLLVAACGGGGDEGGNDGELLNATAACDEAFAAAVPATEDPTIPTAGEETPSGPEGGDDLVTVTLHRLTPTLEECEDADDWMAGARAHRDALPAGFDVVAALRLLCEVEESDATPCREVAVADEVDDAGAPSP